MNCVKKITLLFSVILLGRFIAWADTLSDFTSSKSINAPKAAVLVVDLKNDREILAHNAKLPLIPASIMKCVTTATLLDKVGEDFRYETAVKYGNRIKNGVLEGDLVIEASGDPSIGTHHEPGSENLVDEIIGWLKENRVRTIQGIIVIDESSFPGNAVNPFWQKGDLPYSYGTGTHGFNYMDNACGDKSVKDPAAVFRSHLTRALTQADIRVSGEDVSESRRHTLGVHRSAPIDEIMRSCMMRSDNQFAEAFLRLTGDKYGDDGSTVEGARRELNFWKHKKADTEGVKIVDGSGLSRENRVTANFMADVLKKMAHNPYYASFFPLAGQEGTLKKFLAGTELEGYMALKTGSMNGIQCYAGYKLDDNYEPTHVVVVIMNEMKNRAAARAEVEKLLLKTFAR